MAKDRAGAHPEGPRDDEIAAGKIGQGLERLVYFSDAVIAIAMTLLAIELPIPEGDDGSELWQSFLEYLRQDYFTFALSFVVIALFWVGHHRMFMWIDHLGPGLIPRNFCFLFLIVIMPFATRMLDDTDGSTLGTVFYASVVTAIGLIRLEMLRFARRRGLLRPEGEHQRSRVNPVWMTTIAFGLSIPIAFASPEAAMWSWLILSVIVGQVLQLLRRRQR